MAMHIVMVASAKPVKIRGMSFGNYRNVAVVQLTQEFTAQNKRPSMISDRARGILKIVWKRDRLHVGKTAKCEFNRTLAEAKAYAAQLNNLGDMADARSLIAPGSA